jgi:hypothetical protein
MKFNRTIQKLNPHLCKVVGKRKAKQSKVLNHRFESLWRLLGGPTLQPEFQFHPKRKWRFDYCHLGTCTAIELEGGIWVKGAHSRGAHFNSDCEKYNSATICGFSLFRLTTNSITVENIQPIIDFINDKR